jgi:hypothetical protein
MQVVVKSDGPSIVGREAAVWFVPLAVHGFQPFCLPLLVRYLLCSSIDVDELCSIDLA